MKKRVVAMLTVLLLILVQVKGIAMPVNATGSTASVKLQLSVDKESVRKGQTFYLTYNLTNASPYDISYLSFAIYYNSSDFEYCEFVADSANHYHSGSNSAADSTTGKITVEFESNANSAYLHGQSKNASIAFKMKYKGSGYMQDSVQEFYVGDIVVKSEASYTYTGIDYTFGSAEVETQSAAITLNALSGDNTLSNIELKVSGSKIALEPSFSPEVTQYAAYVEYTGGSIDAKFPANDSAATVSHNFSRQINTGSNDYYIVVTAENGSIRTYNINLHLIPQGMTVAEYKEYLSSLNTPVSSAPEVASEPEIISSTDVSDSDDVVSSEAPIIVPEEITPTDKEILNSSSEPVKSAGGLRGFLESISPAVLIGALGGLILLVAGGFTAGYIAHKKVQREKMLTNYLDYYNDDYYDDGYTDYGYGDDYYEPDEYYDEY